MLWKIGIPVIRRLNFLVCCNQRRAQKWTTLNISEEENASFLWILDSPNFQDKELKSKKEKPTSAKLDANFKTQAMSKFFFLYPTKKLIPNLHL